MDKILVFQKVHSQNSECTEGTESLTDVLCSPLSTIADQG